MREIWLISDTHFQHANILTFTDEKNNLIRGSLFSSVEEMNECMVDNWNDTVKDGDIVYHLGDVFFGDKESFKKLWSKLKGKKRLILGNHDNAKFFINNNLCEVKAWRYFSEYNLVLSHFPLDMSSAVRQDSLTVNVHGHIHQQPSPTNKHRCVCVEQINYTPINIEEICL